MSEKYQEILLGELIQRKKEDVEVQDINMYKRLTIHMNGQGISVRDQVIGSAIGTKHQFIVKSGQFVLSKIDARNGAFGIVPMEGDGAIITGNFWAFDVDYERFNVEFFNYLTRTPLFIDFCVMASDGTTNRRYLREEKFLSQRIKLPPLEEQRRIVARIEELAAKIEEARGLRREAVETSDQLLIRATDSVLSSTEWKKIPIGDLLRENSRNGLSSFPSSSPPGIPILRISSATSREDAIIDENDYRYIELSDQDNYKYKVERDDILVCRFNGNLHNVGRFALYENYLGIAHVYPDKLIRLRIDNNKVLSKFVCLVTNSSEGRKAIESFCATTAGNIGISASNLKSVPISVPPLSEQKRIVDYLDTLQSYKFTIKQKQSETAAELDALLPSILDKAFKGEL